MNKAFVWKDEGDYTKELMKVFSGSSAMWREWRMIAKGVYVGELAGSHSVGRPRKRCTDNVKNCLRKRSLWMSGKQEEWCRIGVNSGVYEGECMGHNLGNEPLSMMRCHS